MILTDMENDLNNVIRCDIMSVNGSPLIKVFGAEYVNVLQTQTALVTLYRYSYFLVGCIYILAIEGGGGRGVTSVAGFTGGHDW